MFFLTECTDGHRGRFCIFLRNSAFSVSQPNSEGIESSFFLSAQFIFGDKLNSKVLRCNPLPHCLSKMNKYLFPLVENVFLLTAVKV